MNQRGQVYTDGLSGPKGSSVDRAYDLPNLAEPRFTVKEEEDDSPVAKEVKEAERERRDSVPNYDR